MADFARERGIVDESPSETLPDVGAGDEVVSDDSRDGLFWWLHKGLAKNVYSPILDSSVRPCRWGDSRGCFACL